MTGLSFDRRHRRERQQRLEQSPQLVFGAAQGDRELRPRRNLGGERRHEHQRRIELVGPVAHDVAPCADHRGDVARVEHDVAADEPIGWNRLEGEPRDDAEVASAPAHRPEEVGVRLGVDGEHLTGRGDELDLAQRIDREALHAHEPPDATAEREPAHADVAGVARADAEAVRGECGRDVAPTGTAADRDEAVVAHLDRRELGEVDDQPVFDGQQPVAAASDGDRLPGRRCPRNRLGDLVDGVRPNDRVGFADAGEDGAAGVELGVAGTEGPAWNAFSQVSQQRHSDSLAAGTDMRNRARSARNPCDMHAPGPGGQRPLTPSVPDSGEWAASRP